MIIWGFGRKIRFFKKAAFIRTCTYCNEESEWHTTYVTSWFTLFFIPIFPYSFTKVAECPSCKAYVKLDDEEFESLREYK